jgi:uncharacterized coiled-coil protein SlyX
MSKTMSQELVTANNRITELEGIVNAHRHLIDTYDAKVASMQAAITALTIANEALTGRLADIATASEKPAQPTKPTAPATGKYRVVGKRKPSLPMTKQAAQRKLDGIAKFQASHQGALPGSVTEADVVALKATK